jgi:hypothetical protein
MELEPMHLSRTTRLRRWCRAAAFITLAALAFAAQAGPDDHPGGHGPGPAPRGQWWDGAHGHAHYYPAPGYAVRVAPPHSQVVFWSGTRYAYHEGVWYSPGPHGYVVVRPPYGVVVPVLPVFRSAVVIGGLTYLYANGAYYREVIGGGYEVVPPPVAPASEPMPPAAAPKAFVYPRQGQTAEQQATDEYECHRWAAGQSGFDPTASATGMAGGDASRRSDYGRARSACLEGRGYTVR